MAPRKSHPKGIDPAYPNRNFVKMTFDNKGDDQGFFEYMYGGNGYPGSKSTQDGSKKASGYGHSIGQRAGKLRLSGKAGAHRIGKR